PVESAPCLPCAFHRTGRRQGVLMDGLSDQAPAPTDRPFGQRLSPGPLGTGKAVKIAILVGRASPVSMTEDTSDSRQERAVALSRALAARGHRITVYSRRSGPGLPEHVCPDAHVEVEHLPVGPAVPL